MPVYFLKSLKVVGVKTLNIRTSTINTKRVTMAVMIAGDSTLLLLTIVFKGKHNSRITKMEVRTCQTTHQYCCQEAAWMDKQVMLAWVDKVLTPCIATAPKDVIPLLILNSYQFHMMALVVHKFRSQALRSSTFLVDVLPSVSRLMSGSINPSWTTFGRCGLSG